MTDTRRRVLYIDDDDGLRHLVRKLLERRGYEVGLAADGEAGLAMVQADAFDVVAVDHYMPGRDGLETLKAIRALPEPPPIVYVTGSQESSVAVAALKAGAADYVVKSIGDDFIDLLDRTFAQALEQSRLRDEKEAAEDALRVSNARLETLLREVNHRVANSLQLVSAFVTMQGRTLPDAAAREALKDTERRIQAIAQVHRRLYTSDDVESVAMDEYLAALVAELEDTYSTAASPRAMMVEADPLRLQTDKAVSLGVIVNELVSNACKYAYDPSASGEIRVSLKRDGDAHFLLGVEDDGCGLPLGDATPRGSGLGAKLVRAMAQSLNATLSYDPAHMGCKALLRAAV